MSRRRDVKLPRWMAGDSVLDLGLLAVVAWCILLGLSLGAWRMLVALAAFVGAMFVVELGSPWLRALDGTGDLGGAGEWLRRVLSADLPASYNVPLRRQEVDGIHLAAAIHTTYLQVTLVCYSVAVAVGFLLALRSLEVLWRAEAVKRSSRSAGGLLGLLLGGIAVGFLLRIIAFIGWWWRLAFIVTLARRSLLFGMWGRWLALHHHGIFF